MAPQGKAEPTADVQTPQQGPASPGSAQGKWLVERPAAGLGRGHYAWPEWGVLGLGGLVTAVGFCYFGLKLRRFFRKK